MTNETNSVVKQFEPLFYPKAIAIIGASYNPAGGGYFVDIMRGRFRNPMYLFNPRLAGQELYGYKVYSSILEIPEDKPIDYAIIGVPAKIVPGILKEVGKKKYHMLLFLLQDLVKLAI